MAVTHMEAVVLKCWHLSRWPRVPKIQIPQANHRVTPVCGAQESAFQVSFPGKPTAAILGSII